MLVLVSAVVLKWQRTLRLMDGLFEQIAEEETAHRVSCEIASVEWLADEKEKAAHREEALRLQLHHAQVTLGLSLGLSLSPNPSPEPEPDPNPNPEPCSTCSAAAARSSTLTLTLTL